MWGRRRSCNLDGMAGEKPFTLLKLPVYCKRGKIPEWEDFLERGHLSNYWKEDHLQFPQVSTGSHSHQLLGQAEQAWGDLHCEQKVESMVPSGTRKLHNPHSFQGFQDLPQTYTTGLTSRTCQVFHTDYSSLTNSPHTSVLRAQALESE